MEVGARDSDPVVASWQDGDKWPIPQWTTAMHRNAMGKATKAQTSDDILAFDNQYVKVDFRWNSPKGKRKVHLVRIMHGGKAILHVDVLAFGGDEGRARSWCTNIAQQYASTQMSKDDVAQAKRDLEKSTAVKARPAASKTAAKASQAAASASPAAAAQTPEQSSTSVAAAHAQPASQSASSHSASSAAAPPQAAWTPIEPPQLQHFLFDNHIE